MDARGVGDLEAYFGEAGGFVVEVAADDVEAFEGIADDVTGVCEIGVTIDQPMLAIERRGLRSAPAASTCGRAAARGLSVSRRIAVLVFPGTNSEDETLRLLRDCGGDAHLVHWSRATSLAVVRCVRAARRLCLRGSHSRRRDRRARRGDGPRDRRAQRRASSCFGICNGAQILLEAGLVPGTGAVRRPTAAFTRNGPVPHFVCAHVYVKLGIDPVALRDYRGAAARRAGSGVGRATARAVLPPTRRHLQEIEDGGHVAFVYAHADGSVDESASPE